MISEPLWLAMLLIALLAGILTGIPVMLVISGVPLLVALVGSLVGVFDLGFLHAYPQRLFGMMNNAILIAIPLFVLMGVLLERSRLAERMLISVSRLLGGSRATLALAVIVVSALLAASTGVIAATIVMLGMISLPALLQAGISKRMASGLICASGTLGQIIPPSIVLVLLGDQISNAYVTAQRKIGNFAPDPVTVGDLFAGALLPGMVLVGLYGAYVALKLSFKPLGHGARQVFAIGEDAADRPDIWPMLLDVVPPVLLILAVLGSILLGVATPTEAAAIGVCGTLLLTASSASEQGSGLRQLMALTAAAAVAIVVLKNFGLTRIDFSTGRLAITPISLLAIALAGIVLCGLMAAAVSLWRRDVLVGALASTVQVSAMIFGIIAAASMLSLVFRGFGGEQFIHEVLAHVPGGKWGLLAVTMLVIFGLGFVLEFVEIIFIIIPIIGPVLLATDIDPIWFAVLVAMNLQTSFLTPPFGFSLFYFRSVAPDSISTGDIYRSIVPFVCIQLVAIAIVAFVPALATWLPARLFG